MTALPASTDFTNSSVTEGGFKTAISDLRAYLAFLLGEDGTKETAQLTLGAGFPSGTRMSFNQTSAPSGWTKDVTSTLNDSIIRIVTGTVGNGGSVAFSTWNSSGLTGATTLSTSQLPNLAYQVYRSGNTGTTGGTGGSRISGTSNAGSQANIWYDVPNNVLNGMRDTNAGGSHTHTISSDLKYRDFIIATKD